MFEWWRRRAAKQQRLEDEQQERSRLKAQWEEERRQEKANKLAALREQFRCTLVGRWRPVTGSASVLANELWTVLPDGTGQKATYRIFGQPEQVEHFEWKHLGDWSLALRSIRTEFVDSDDAEVPDKEDDEPAEENPWVDLHYDFVLVPSEGGENIGLCSFRFGTGDASRTFFDGRQTFWGSLAPLSYVGPPE